MSDGKEGDILVDEHLHARGLHRDVERGGGLVDEPHLARHIASFLVTTAWTDSKPHPVRPERITLESFLADRRRNSRFVDRFRLELWQQDLLCLLLYVIFLLAAYSPSKLVAGEFPYKVNSATAIYFSLLICYFYSRMVG